MIPTTPNPDAGCDVARRTSERFVPTVAIAAACLLVAAAHWPALSAKALFIDDGHFVIENPLVLHPSWDSARRFLAEVLEPSTVPGYYLPLSMISLMLDAALGGTAENLAPFHRTSLALHLLNTALVILILYRLFRRPIVAAAVGLLFGLHPLTVDPVVWLGERKTVLCAFFAFASILTYLHYVERRRRTIYAASLVLFVLALLSKPTCTPLPVALLLLDWWPLGRLSRRAILEKAPFFAIAALSAAITVISHERTGDVSVATQGTAWRIPLTLCHNIIFYLYEVVWPRNLATFCLIPEPFNLSNRMILAGLIGTCLLLPLLLVSLRWTRALVAGVLLFFVMLLPAMGIVRVTDSIAWDKYAYLPSIGLLVIVAWAFCHLERRSFGRIALCTSVIVLASLELLGTRRQLALWQDSETLVRYVLSQQPRSGTLHNRLGTILEDAGKADEAFAHYEEAVRLMPSNPYARNNLALALTARGRDAEARQHCEAALAVKHVPYEVHYNYALRLVQNGQPQEAIAQLRAALAKKPDFTPARGSLADLLTDDGQFAEALEHYRLALADQPQSANLHNNLGSALRRMERVDEAIVEFERALAIDPRSVASTINLANALRQMGRLDEAIQRYRAAITIEPSQGAAHFNLGTALFEKRKFAEAEDALREAVRLLPNNADAHFFLGRAMEEQGRKEDAATEYRETLRLNPNHDGAKSKLTAI